MSLQKAKKTDPTLIHAVFGFVRGWEKKSSTNVPVIIKYLISNFYSLIDKFAEHDGTALFAAENMFAVKNIPLMSLQQRDHQFTIIKGNVEVGQMYDDETEYEWTLKIQSQKDEFVVGLIPASNQKVALHYGGTELYAFCQRKGEIGIVNGGKDLASLLCLCSKPKKKYNLKLRFNVKKMKLCLEMDGWHNRLQQFIPTGIYSLFVGLFENLDTARLLKFTIKMQ